MGTMQQQQELSPSSNRSLVAALGATPGYSSIDGDGRRLTLWRTKQ
jgi:hypothetical protein